MRSGERRALLADREPLLQLFFRDFFEAIGSMLCEGRKEMLQTSDERRERWGVGGQGMGFLARGKGRRREVRDRQEITSFT